MDFRSFDALAHDMFSRIPAEYRAGVDGLEVLRRTEEHPTLPEVYTLGECKSEFYPSDFGGAGEVRSMVVLYYGSFLALSRLRDDWDWEEELWETITHEVRHHLESLAVDDALEEMDYAEDQNFARRQGEPFDPFFFRSAPPVEDGAYEVDGDVFMERPLTRRGFRDSPVLEFEWGGAAWRLPRPERQGDVHFLAAAGVVDEPGEFHLVLVRQRGAWEWLRDLLAGSTLEVLESEVEAERA